MERYQFMPGHFNVKDPDYELESYFTCFDNSLIFWEDFEKALKALGKSCCGLFDALGDWEELFEAPGEDCGLLETKPELLESSFWK